MAHLLDTSVLARLANTADPFHAVATQAVLELHRGGEVLHLTAQNLVEFRNLATRPKAVNGLGLSAVCHVHSVTHVLTFNVSHFVGMAGFGPGIVVVDPATL